MDIQPAVEALGKDVESTIGLLRQCFADDSDLGDLPANRAYSSRIIQNSLILKEKGEVISHVGVANQTVMVSEGQLDVASVGWVCTRPDHRKKGLMSRLLRASIQRMHENHVAISDLAGDRQRYGHFGWELGGMEWRYRVTRRSFESWTKPPRYRVENIESISRDILDRTLVLHNSFRVGVRRDRKLHNILLSRPGRLVIVARSGSEIASYAVVNRTESRFRVEEMGGGQEGFHAILGELFKVPGIEFIDLRLPYRNDLNIVARGLSASWHLACLRMIKIIDLESLLKALSRQLLLAYQRLGFEGQREVTLGLKGEERGVRIQLSPEGVVLTQSRLGKDAVVLPEKEMVHLIFGPGCPPLPPESRGRAGLLSGIFPVDFFIWPNEMI